MLQCVDKMELGAAGAAEVPHLGMVHTELVVDVVDELGNEKIEIGVALSVAMRWHVERHSLEARLEIRTVVEVEPAHEILVGLAVARVLRDDHARHGLEQLTLSSDRTEGKIGGADATL